MATRVLHISNSPYASLEDAGPSRLIFKELSAGCSEYHVLAPNVKPWRGYDRDGRLHLHLLPGRSAKLFALLAYTAVPLVRRHGLDGIVCQDPLLGGVAGVHAGRLTRVPVLIELHTDLYFAALRSRDPWRRMLGRAALHALTGADRVRVAGPEMSARLEHLGVSRDRMTLVPYRVDTGFFAPGAADRQNARARLRVGSGPLFTSVGRFVPQKGYLELLPVFAEVRRKLPDARLVLAGGGPLAGKLEHAVDSHGLEGAVELTGWISREEQRDLLAASDVYLQPSRPDRGEWMPRTILEAMAMHLPVIASAVGGIADVVRDGADGLLVPPGSDASLTEAMVRLGDDAAERERLGSGARTSAVQRFAWRQAFDTYRSAIRDLGT